MGFEVEDTEIRLRVSVRLKQDVRKVDHEKSEVGGIGHTLLGVVARNNTLPENPNSLSPHFGKGIVGENQRGYCLWSVRLNSGHPPAGLIGLRVLPLRMPLFLTTGPKSFMIWILN
jgi:hypothetical protein